MANAGNILVKKKNNMKTAKSWKRLEVKQDQTVIKPPPILKMNTDYFVHLFFLCFTYVVSPMYHDKQNLCCFRISSFLRHVAVLKKNFQIM